MALIPNSIGDFVVQGDTKGGLRVEALLSQFERMVVKLIGGATFVILEQNLPIRICRPGFIGMVLIGLISADLSIRHRDYLNASDENRWCHCL